MGKEEDVILCYESLKLIVKEFGKPMVRKVLDNIETRGKGNKK